MNKLWLTFVMLMSCTRIFAQEVVLSGTVRDGDSGETLIGALVAIDTAAHIGSTNGYGFYSLTVPAGKHRVTFSYIGYQTHTEEIGLRSNKRYNIELQRVDNELEEVIVSAKRKDDNVTNPQMGVLNFTMEAVKNVPVVFGEKDLLKTIQLLPGVQSEGEGTSNFYVRGGGGDQNLI